MGVNLAGESEKSTGSGVARRRWWRASGREVPADQVANPGWLPVRARTDLAPDKRRRESEGRPKRGFVHERASVRDNLRSPDTKIFYEIVPGGLAEGVSAYIGPRHLWKGRTPTGLPPYLIGADFVRTFISDHREQNLAITVTCSRPAVLYVLFECRPQQQRWREAGNVELAPKWLQEDFQNTGDAVGLDDASQFQPGETMTAKPGQGHLVTFDVWKQEVRELGEVTLGPPTGSDGWLNWMYGIAAKPL